MLPFIHLFFLFLGNHVVAFVPGQKGAPGFAKMFAFPSFNTEKDVIAYKSFMLADRMEAQWSQNSQNVLLLMVFTNFTLLQFHELLSQISNFAANLLRQF